MKGFYALLAVASITLANQAFAEMTFELGGGMAPVYIEEIVSDDLLTAGATVTPIYSVFNAGQQITPAIRLQLSAHHQWYVDAESNTYVSGITGAGVKVELPNMHGLSLHLTGGLANKLILGAGLSSSGWGLNTALSRPVWNAFEVMASYSYLSLSSVASTYATGDAQSISSFQLGVLYAW